MSGRGNQGRGKTASGRGSGGRGRGMLSTLRDSKKTGWEKLGLINFGTSLLTLKRAGFEFAREKYPTVASIFEDQKYIVEDMPSREDAPEPPDLQVWQAKEQRRPGGASRTQGARRFRSVC